MLRARIDRPGCFFLLAIRALIAGFAAYFLWPRSGPAIIHHLRDWHFIEKDAFAADMELSGKDLDALEDVEKVQAEQLPELRKLLDQGVTVIYLEGVTEAQIPDWIKMAKGLREQLTERPALLKMKADAKELKNGGPIAGRGPEDARRHPVAPTQAWRRGSP
jgi:hypothetical protein